MKYEWVDGTLWFCKTCDAETAHHVSKTDERYIECSRCASLTAGGTVLITWATVWEPKWERHPSIMAPLEKLPKGTIQVGAERYKGSV